MDGRSYLVKPMSIMGYAQKLENISKALRELPDLSFLVSSAAPRVVRDRHKDDERQLLKRRPAATRSTSHGCEELRTYLLK